MEPGLGFHLLNLAPEAGFEPATNWLTANCATAALLRNTAAIIAILSTTVKMGASSTRSVRTL